MSDTVNIAVRRDSMLCDWRWT